MVTKSVLVRYSNMAAMIDTTSFNKTQHTGQGLWAQIQHTNTSCWHQQTYEEMVKLLDQMRTKPKVKKTRRQRGADTGIEKPKPKPEIQLTRSELFAEIQILATHGQANQS